MKNLIPFREFQLKSKNRLCSSCFVLPSLQLETFLPSRIRLFLEPYSENFNDLSSKCVIHQFSFLLFCSRFMLFSAVLLFVASRTTRLADPLLYGSCCVSRCCKSFFKTCFLQPRQHDRMTAARQIQAGD